MRPKLLTLALFALGGLSCAYGDDFRAVSSSVKPQTEPVLPASVYSPVKGALDQFAAELSKNHPGFAVVSKVGPMGGTASETAKPMTISMTNPAYVVVVKELSSTTTFPKPAYSKRAFASIPTSIGTATVQILDGSTGAAMGEYRASSAEFTGSDPLESTRAMTQALAKATSDFLRRSK